MYTVKIVSVDGNDSPDMKDTASNFSKRLKEELACFDISIAGVNKFLGQDGYYTIHGFAKRKGEELSFGDWINVNQSINKILDEMKVNALVRAPKYIVRHIG